MDYCGLLWIIVDYCGLLLIVMVTKDKDEVRDNWKDSTLEYVIVFCFYK